MRRARRRPRGGGRSAPRWRNASGKRIADAAGALSPFPWPSPSRWAPGSWRSPASAHTRTASVALRGHLQLRDGVGERAAQAVQVRDRLRVRAQAEGQLSGERDDRDPEGMPVGRLGERAELLDRVPEDHRALLRARYVRDGEGKLTRPGGEAGNSLVERPEPADRVEEGVQRVRIVIELPLFRLGVDQTQALEGVLLRYREVDIEERVAVSELALLLLAGVEADRALDPQV